MVNEAGIRKIWAGIQEQAVVDMMAILARSARQLRAAVIAAKIEVAGQPRDKALFAALDEISDEAGGIEVSQRQA